MNDRSTINARRSERPGLSSTELQAEERKVLAVLLVYAALILFAILGVKVLDRHVEKEQEPLVVGGTT